MKIREINKIIVTNDDIEQVFYGDVLECRKASADEIEEYGEDYVEVVNGEVQQSTHSMHSTQYMRDWASDDGDAPVVGCTHSGLKMWQLPIKLQATIFKMAKNAI